MSSPQDAKLLFMVVAYVFKYKTLYGRLFYMY